MLCPGCEASIAKSQEGVMSGRYTSCVLKCWGGFLSSCKGVTNADNVSIHRLW